MSTDVLAGGWAKVLGGDRKQFNMFIEKMLDGFAYHKIVVDKTGKPVDYVFLEVNHAFEKMTGLKREKIIGKKATEVLSGIEDDPADWIGVYGQVAFTEEPVQFENHSVSLGKWYKVSAYCPEKGYFVALFEEVTESKKTEQALKASEEKANDLIKYAPSGIYELDYRIPPKFRRVNDAMCQILGYTREELLATSPFALLDSESRVRFQERIAKMLAGEKVDETVEFKVVPKDGRDIYAVLNVTFTYKDGKPDGALVIAHDVTERKKVAEVLGESEQRYRELANCLPNIVFETNLNGQLEFVNEKAAEISGYAINEIEKGLNILQFIVTEDRVRAMKNIQRLLSGGVYIPSEYTFLRKNGTTFPALITSTPRICKNKVTGFRGIVLDISEQKKSEEVVRKSEARYRDLSNFLPEIVFETDLTGKITFFNQRAFEISGFTREELEKGLNMLQFVVPQEREKAKENIKKTLTGKGREAHEYTLYKKDGSTYPAIVKTTAIISDTQVTGLRGIVIDITERKLAEEKVLNSALYSRSLLEASIDPLVTISSEGKITDVNKATEEVTGLSRIDLIGSDFSNYFTDPEKARAGYTRVFTEGYVRDYPLAIRNKSGKITDVLYNASIYKNQQGKIQGVFAAARDITERKKTEEAIIESEYSRKRMHDELKLSEERLRLLFEYAPDAYYLSDLKGNFVDGNKSAEEITGYTRNELIGKSFLGLNLLPRNQTLKAAKLLALNVVDKPTGPDEFTLNRKNGTKVSVEIRTHPLKIQGKKLVLGIARDITGRKKVEEAIQNGEKRFRQLVLSSPDTIHLLDPNSHKVEFLNRDEFLGYSCAELEGANSVLPWLHPDDRDLVQGYYQLVLKGAPDGEKPVEYRLKSKVGNWEWVQSRATILKQDEQGKPEQILVTLTVITERKKAEEELKIAASIFDLATDAIFVHDMDGNIINFNEAAYKLHGYSKDEMDKMNIHDFNSPESTKWVKPRINDLLKNGSAVFEAVEVCKDKSLLLVEVHARMVDLGGKKLILSVVRDVTERKVAEEKLKENNVKIELMNEKLRVVGGLSRHDVRNKLSAVNGYAYLLKKKHRDQADIVEGLGKIESAVNESVRIFEFAKMYEQLGVEELAYVDVGKIVDEAVALFSRVTIRVVNDCHGLSVLADSLLRQMFYNFIDNTIKYGERATTIKVHYDKAESGELRLVYEDDGVGISEDNKSKLFTEGFSTGSSTGFGLFFIKKMMNVYGWKITEEGELGKGVKFVITIPPC